MLVVVITVDAIWMYRNSLVHGNKQMDIFLSIQSVHSRFVAHKGAWESQDTREEVSWQPPPPGTIKIKFDTPVKDNLLWAAAVCRNCKGEILRIRMQKAVGSNPLKGEALAARLAFGLTSKLSLRSLLLELKVTL